MADYSQLVNKAGTIYNTQTATGYSSPGQLAADLGVTPDQIQWGQIKSDPNYAPVLNYNIGGQQAMQTISAERTPVSAIQVPEPDYNSTINNANALSSGMESANKSVQDYINAFTPAQTPLDTKYQDTLNSVAQLIGQDTGKQAYQIQQENALGVPEIKQQISDLNSQILSGIAEQRKTQANYDAANLALEQQPQQLASVVGTKQQELQRTFAIQQAAKTADIGLLQARQAALGGQLDTALNLAQRAVDLKYQPIEDELKVKQAQLDAIAPLLDKQEKIQSQALTAYYNDQQQQVADEKAKAKENISLALQGGITSRFANKNGEIYDVNSGIAYSNPQDFFKAAGVTSFEEAYTRGLVQDIKPALTFKTETINGRKVRIGYDAQGNVISRTDLGSSSSGGGSDETPTLSGAASIIKQAWQEQGYIQGNGKISSQDYKDAKEYWTSPPPGGLGFTAAQFDNQFSSLIDKSGPNWRQDYGYTGQ